MKYVDSLLALADCYPEYDVFQIDMVIGLCSSVDQIRSDASFEKRGTVYMYLYKLFWALPSGSLCRIRGKAEVVGNHYVRDISDKEVLEDFSKTVIQECGIIV